LAKEKGCRFPRKDREACGPGKKGFKGALEKGFKGFKGALRRGKFRCIAE
jgi:hypothetical protein